MAAGQDTRDDAGAAARLAQAIENYIQDHPAAALLEDGRVLFDMRNARYSVTESHGRCLLQFWSDERNVMRTVLEVQPRAHCLRLMTRRMGAARPQALELVPTSDRRTPTARDAARRNYQKLLERALTRSFAGAKVDGLRSATDLEHSFGPAYVRGRLLRGPQADAAGPRIVAFASVMTLEMPISNAPDATPVDTCAPLAKVVISASIPARVKYPRSCA